MNQRTFTLGGLALILSVAAMPVRQAVDVTGPWTMTYTTKDGVKMSSTVTFKSENGALAGTITSPRGSVALNEVSVNGNEIAFAVIRVGFGDTIRIDYKGTVKDDTMMLKMTVGAREALDVMAKRQ